MTLERTSFMLWQAGVFSTPLNTLSLQIPLQRLFPSVIFGSAARVPVHDPNQVHGSSFHAALLYFILLTHPFRLLLTTSFINQTSNSLSVCASHGPQLSFPAFPLPY